MGFIRAIPESVCGDIDLIWDSYISADSAEFAVKVGSLSNGERIAVKREQSLLLLCSGKIVDYADAPGGYVYHSAIESFFGEISAENEKLKNENPDLFVDYPVGETELYILNRAAGKYVDFRFDSLDVHDAVYDADIRLSGSGSFGIKPVNPLEFYIKFVMRNGDYSSFSTAFEELIPYAIEELGHYGAAYDELIYSTDVMSEIIGEKLNGSFCFDGVKLGEIFFSSIMPDGDSLIRVMERKRSIAENKQRQALMCAIIYHLAQIAKNKELDEIKSDLWKCPLCGAETFGNFCSVCGGKRPPKNPQRHFCTECGYELTGRDGISFCPQCGTKIVV